MENKIMSHITKGLIIALIGIVIGIGGFMAQIDQESWFRWLSTVITAIGIIWGCIYYAKQLDGNVTFGKIFGHGFKIADYSYTYINRICCTRHLCSFP